MRLIMEEIWKQIPTFNNYEVSSFGRVKSLRFNKEKIMSQCLAGGGYPSLRLTKDGVSKLMYVHQLVAMAFLKHKRKGYNGLVVDHIDNNKQNNNINNIQLITARLNTSKDRKGTSKYTGVCWDKQMNKWRSTIRVNGTSVFLGLFDCELAAAKAYNKRLKNYVKTK